MDHADMQPQSRRHAQGFAVRAKFGGGQRRVLSPTSLLMPKPALILCRTLFIALLFCAASASNGADGWKAGAAAIDITPDYPVRLSGYGNRTGEFDGVTLHIWAKALALQWGDEKLAVALTIDSTGIPAAVRSAVLKKLADSGHSIDDERFSLHSSHSHSAPQVRGYLPFIAGQDFTPEENEHIDRYTKDVIEKLAAVVQQALGKMEPARLDWGIGTVKFASNRRYKTPTGDFTNSPNPEGPTDHALPVLRVTGIDGKLRAIFTSYACHCTVLGFNQVHGDWAGEAQREMQERFPGVIAMTAIGCAGDQNPYPRRSLELARAHGISLANEAAQVVQGPLKPVRGPLVCVAQKFALPLDAIPTKDEWQKRSGDKNKWTAYQGKFFLKMLERRQPIATEVPYSVQSWQFGDDLVVVNLPGEVVVDYSLRLKRELDPARTWVNAYTNDVPCYIPSQRVWQEGGYEAAGAMLYYGWPARFASGIEEKIIGAARQLVPAKFVAPSSKAQ